MRALTVVDEPPGPSLVAAVLEALEGGSAVAPLPQGIPAPMRQRLLTALAPELGVASSVALVVMTSGSTTGTPKGVELTAEALLASARASVRRLELTPSDRWLACLPMSSIGGLQVVVRSWLLGSEAIVLPHFDTSGVAGAISEVNCISLVPTMLARLLDAGAEVSKLKHVLLGGAPAPPALLARARAAGVKVTTTYGMTETAGGCVYDGLPLDGVDIAVDLEGHVVISGPVLARAYRYGDDERLLGKRFVTSDRGRIRDDGRLEVLGRADDVILTGGYNVVAGRVAAALTEHPGVAEAAVVGRPDAEWGQRVVAIVVPTDAGEPPTLSDLRNFLSSRTARHEAPRELILVASLPLLPSGKVDRLALAEITGILPAGNPAQVRPLQGPSAAPKRKLG